MGLDNFWDLPSNTFLEFEPPLQLMGGMYSRNGQRSFRGKVYFSFFLEELGVDLQSTLSNEEVREITSQLDATEWQEAFADEYSYPNTEQELNDLTRMFDAYGQADARLTAWY